MMDMIDSPVKDMWRIFRVSLWKDLTSLPP